MRRVSIFALCLGLACNSPLGEPVSVGLAPIIGGEFTPGDPAVVALVDGFGLAYCSGTLVAPHVVVTAGHCLYYGNPPAFVYFGSAPGDGGTTVPVASSEYHADFDEALNNDIGVVILAAAAPAEVTPVPMARRAPEVGADARFVGFGCRDTGPQPCEDAGLKYQVTAAITQVRSRDFRYGVATCQGDSGGPAFVDEHGREVLAGLTSYGDTPCEEYGYDTRVDAYRSWVIDFIEAHDPGFELDDPPLPDEDGGCGCRTGGRPRGSGMAVVAVLALVPLIRRRRG